MNAIAVTVALYVWLPRAGMEWKPELVIERHPHDLWINATWLLPSLHLIFQGIRL